MYVFGSVRFIRCWGEWIRELGLGLPILWWEQVECWMSVCVGVAVMWRGWGVGRGFDRYLYYILFMANIANPDLFVCCCQI